jgi:hypothetical protein
MGVPAVTVKPLTIESVSLPVVTETVRVPRAAVGLMVMFAIAAVGELTVSEFTVMSAPKFAVLVSCEKFVPCPVIATLRV